MDKTAKELIKLGQEKPELRSHLRPILDHLTKTARSPEYGNALDIADALGLNSTGLSPVQELGVNFLAAYDVAGKLKVEVSKLQVGAYNELMDIFQSPYQGRALETLKKAKAILPQITTLLNEASSNIRETSMEDLRYYKERYELAKTWSKGDFGWSGLKPDQLDLFRQVVREKDSKYKSLTFEGAMDPSNRDELWKAVRWGLSTYKAYMGEAKEDLTRISKLESLFDLLDYPEKEQIVLAIVLHLQQKTGDLIQRGMKQAQVYARELDLPFKTSSSSGTFSSPALFSVRVNGDTALSVTDMDLLLDLLLV